MGCAAEVTFRQLPSFGCRHTALSFNALLTACFDAGDFGRMDKIFLSFLPENPEILPDHISYSIVISSMCKRNGLGISLCMLEMMEERGALLSLITFSTLLNGYCAGCHFSEAENVWDMMAEKSCVPDVKSFNAKLRGLVSEGRTSEAVELVGQLPSMGLKPDTCTFNALSKRHCGDDNLGHAKKVFENLAKSDCLPNQVLQEVVDGLLKQSRLDDAKKLVKPVWLNCYNRKSIGMPSPSSNLLPTRLCIE